MKRKTEIDRGVAGDTAGASLKIALGETRAAGLVRLTHGLPGRLLTPARFNAYIATNRKQSHAPPSQPRRPRPRDPGSPLHQPRGAARNRSADHRARAGRVRLRQRG